MDRCVLLGVFASLAIISGVLANEAKVLMQITQEYATVGEVVTVSCEVINSDPGSTISIQKEVGEETETITANKILIGKYLEKGRFDYTVTPMGESSMYTLTINGVTYEDSGRYTCILVDHMSKSSVPFDVYRNTEHLAFYVNGTEVEKNEQIDLEEGKEMSINCTAGKALPYPKMYINLGDRDITDKFTKHEQLIAECVHHKECLLHAYYNSSLYNHMYKARWTENGKVVKCKAIIEEQKDQYEHGFDQTETQITVNVTHAPVVNCSQSTYYASLGKNFVIRCPLFTNPELSSDDITLTSEDGSILLKPGEEYYGLSFRYTANSELGKPGEVQMTWQSVEQKQLKKYDIKASNIIGERKFTFELFRADDTEEPDNPGSASMTQISIFSLVLAAVIALVNH